ATSCPPPRHNFTELPRIRSERPAFELHYPHMIERMRAEAHVGLGTHPLDHVRVVQLERGTLRPDTGQLGEVVPRRRAAGG
ncbi:hypothetical protein C6A85_08650, partial [Mycobacterium sp. ITM-2017-0098]